ncbi:MAG: hypothetical protein M3Z31_15735 [Pseudomonadota bacterium]|nr:hypothetical protein [Pseudomonadota bacterium]
MDLLDLVQWPAMAVTVLAAWLVASLSKHRRTVGFWAFIVSNVLWIVWGWHDGAYALITLQVALAALNIRGVFKNDPELAAKAAEAAHADASK